MFVNRKNENLLGWCNLRLICFVCHKTMSILVIRLLKGDDIGFVPVIVQCFSRGYKCLYLSL